MMRRWRLAAAVGLVLLGGVATTMARPAGRVLPLPGDAVSPAAPQPLPARLQQALDTAIGGRHVIRAVAVDLDRDGDLDVVASTRDEAIVVLLNDGLGRLTRARTAGRRFRTADYLTAPWSPDQPADRTTGRQQPLASEVSSLVSIHPARPLGAGVENAALATSARVLPPLRGPPLSQPA
jgi:hypothetical protein